MTLNSYLSPEELSSLGFNKFGINCRISRFARFYNTSAISIGNNTRIDDFCIFSPSSSGSIKIGDNVHIAPYSLLSGRELISIHDHVNISSRVNIYSSSDDFSGLELPGPQSQQAFYQPFESAPIYIASFSIVGSGSVLLPGANLSKGSSIGALSLVKNTIPPFTVFAGIPAQFLYERKKDFLRSLDV
tara:strand:- start:214 stop:777 length:564 start_codon:yes stop_codon:yes gene_type:complete